MYVTRHITRHFIILPLCVAFAVSCNSKRAPRVIEPSFYYWKSVYTLSGFEQQCLDSLHVKTLYIKFFDVDWDEQNHSPKPVAKLQPVSYALQKDIQVIPTVFITNECIQKLDSSQVAGLTSKIFLLTTDMLKANGFGSIPEIQIDCDWTAATKANYFSLLEKTKALWKNKGIPVSATIRLHQVKFLAKTGVPPVDKGLLMCYNMGNLKDPRTKNSILETEELKKYTGNLSDYPFPLDIALPLFEWNVLFRNGFYTGLLRDLPDTIMTSSFAKRSGNRYEITKDTVVLGYDLRKGDVIRNEQTELTEILSTAAEINRHLKNTRPRVALYHLDSVILSKYSIHELESIYSSLH